MSYNGSGTFQINTAGQPVVTGTTISSTAFNALTADLATGLSTAIAKDGQTTPTANLPMGTFKHTGVAAASASTDYVRYDQIGSQQVPIGGIGKNRLINPHGAIWQRAIAAANDLAYFVDCFQLLTQTNTVTPSALTDPENGYATGVRITQSQAVAQRFGFMQKIESLNCRDLRGSAVAMSPRIRASAGQAIRYAILEWIGTANSITNDPVLDWTSATYTSGNFFVAANFNVLAVGSMTPSANTWTALTTLTAACGSSQNNIIVLVWTEGTAAQNFTLDFDAIQLEKGSIATETEYRSFEHEKVLCQDFCRKSFAIATAPAQNLGFGTGESHFIAGVASTSANACKIPVRFDKPMAGTPTVTLYNPSAANAEVRDVTASANLSSSTASSISTNGFRVDATGNGATAAGDLLAVHWLAVWEL